MADESTAKKGAGRQGCVESHLLWLCGIETCTSLEKWQSQYCDATEAIKPLEANQDRNLILVM